MGCRHWGPGCWVPGFSGTDSSPALVGAGESTRVAIGAQCLGLIVQISGNTIEISVVQPHPDTFKKHTRGYRAKLPLISKPTFNVAGMCVYGKHCVIQTSHPSQAYGDLMVGTMYLLNATDGSVHTLPTPRW